MLGPEQYDEWKERKGGRMIGAYKGTNPGKTGYYFPKFHCTEIKAAHVSTACYVLFIYFTRWLVKTSSKAPNRKHQRNGTDAG